MASLLFRQLLNLRLKLSRPCRIVTTHKYLIVRLYTHKSTVKDSSTVIPIFQHAKRFGDQIALTDHKGDYTYQELLESSHRLARQISASLKGKVQERVAFLCHNDASYVIAQWASWMSGQIAVPLTTAHPPALHEYYIQNSEASVVITTSDLLNSIRRVAEKTKAELIVLDEVCKQSGKSGTNTSEAQPLLDNNFYQESIALMIYTSGTTGAPKGVVVSHSNLQAQVSSLLEAWGWSKNDAVLHVLPLNHIHGIVNVLLCPLTVGARCVMLPQFDAAAVWNHLLGTTTQVNLFMAVPTIYIKLLEAYDNMVAKNPELKNHVYKTCSENIRLMVSGSSPLPVPVFKRWETVTGHKLLERFGMSETGMVLSNPLDGDRKPGFVGNPLPGMEVQIVRQSTNNTYEVLVYGSASKGTTVLSEEANSGDLLVRGPNMFKGYWKLPEATKKEFTEDGWFKTGDTAQYDKGAYKILGRTSVDIIKTGGYKVSAVEIETQFLAHPDILDCSVIGLPDNTWGQKVSMVIVTRGGKNISHMQLREWGKKRMAPYAIPTTVKIVKHIPKNALGKTNKKELIKSLFPEAAQS